MDWSQLPKKTTPGRYLYHLNQDPLEHPSNRHAAKLHQKVFDLKPSEEYLLVGNWGKLKIPPPGSPALNCGLLLVHVGQLEHQQVKEGVRGQRHRLAVGFED